MKPSAAFPKRWTEAFFTRRALELFALQRERNPVYAAYCRQNCAVQPKRWQDIPALPVSAFKFHRVACFAPTKTIRTFMTSGTTRGDLRGRHEYASLARYDETVRVLFREWVLPDLKAGERIPIVFLVQPTGERPESSLSYMGSRVQTELGKGIPFYAVNRGGLNASALTEQLKRLIRAGKPILIFTTTFALADYLDDLTSLGVRLKLPHGSRILETGGYKGRRTEITREDLVERVALRLGIPAARVINEYGMTELTSQFYDRSMKSGRSRRIKSGAPWTRVLIIDPRTGRPVAKGRRGLIRIIDLANEGSCLAVQTEDEGRLTSGGFEVLGRRKGADLRGCSLTFEAMRGLRS